MAQYDRGHNSNAKDNQEAINYLSRRLGALEKLIKQGGVTAQEAMDNMDNSIGGWNELNIDNLPDRFFTRDDIEIEGHGDFDIELDGSYKWRKEYLNLENRPYMVKNINIGYKYRYRIQDKKTIQINESMFRTLMSYHGGIGLSKQERLDDLEERYGNKVIIID